MRMHTVETGRSEKGVFEVCACTRAALSRKGVLVDFCLFGRAAALQRSRRRDMTEEGAKRGGSILIRAMRR